MGFVPFNDVIKLTAVFQYDQQRCVNVHHYTVQPNPTTTTAQTLGESYIDWWTTNMRGWVSNALYLIQVECTIMENENDPSVIVSTGLPLLGTRTSQGLPSNVSLAVKWTTQYKGRSYRGRTFHIGLCEDMVNFNTVDGASITGLTNAYAELMSLQADGDAAIMCVASRFHNHVERLQGVATPVTNVVINSTVDSQRRRLPGRGR